MKKLFLLTILLASTLSSRLVNAQIWTNVPGITASRVACASATQVAAISNSSEVFTLNGSTWATQGGTLSEITITTGGVLWGIAGSTSIGSSGPVYTKTPTGTWTLVNTTIGTFTGMSKISVRSGTTVVACHTQSGKLYRYNGTSWSGYSDLASPAGIAGAADATLIAIGPTTTVGGVTRNLYRLDFTTWTPFNGFFPNGKVAVRSGTQMLAIRNTDLYLYNGTSWVLKRSEVRDVAVASDGTVYIVTLDAVNNVFRSTWEQVLGIDAPVAVGGGTFCIGENVTLSVASPVIGLTYLWSNGQTGATTTVNAGGSYTVQAISACCTSAASNVAFVQQVSPPTAPTIAGPSTVCAFGGVATLNVANPVAGATYKWYRAGTIVVGGSGPSFTATFAGVYSVKILDGLCESAQSAAVTVSGTPFPPSITGNAIVNNAATICPGTPITLNIASPAANTTYLWSNGETGNTITVSPTATTSYTARTISAGCTSQASTAVAINVLVVPATPTIGGLSSNTCTSATVALAVVNYLSTNVYLWNDGILGANRTVSVSGSYTVRTIAGGCTSAVSQPKVVTITPLPTTPAIIGTASFCAGGSTTLSVANPVANTTYLWSNGTTGNSITVSAAGSFTVSAISAAACTSAASPARAVTVNTVPAPVISGNASVCTGGNIVLNIASPVTGTTYVWSNGTVGTSISLTPTTGTTPSTLSFTAQAIANGCTSAVSVAKTITVNPIPDVPAISGPTSVCLTAGGIVLNVSNPVAGYTYGWDAGTINIGIGTSLFVNGPGNYRVRVTGPCASQPSAAITVTALPNTPIINGGFTTICAGATITLPVFQPIANATYLWSDGQTGSSIVASPPAIAGTYSYQVRAIVNGCTSAVSQSAPITVRAPLVTPVIAGNTNICGGATATLSIANPVANTTYLWSNGTTANSIGVTTAGNVTVRAISAGCTSAVSQAAAVTVTPLPSAPSISGTASFCAGGNTTLSVSSPAANTTYLWSNGTTANSITVSAAGNFTVRAISNGCTSAVSPATAVTVNALPTTPTISGTASFCVGGNTTLSVANPAANTTYLWSNGTTANSITVSAAGNFTVRAISNGCTSAVSPATAVTVTPLPSAPSILGTASFCEGGNTTLSVSSPAANTTYLWSNGTTANSITVSAAGNFTVRAISNGCTSVVSPATAITVTPLPSAPSISGIASFCTGGNTTLSVASPAANTTYLWSNGTTANSITVSVAGSFTVRAISAAGCTSAVSPATAVTVTPLPSTPAISGTASFCTGGNTTLSVASPVANTTYLWSNGTTANSITVSAAGGFTVRAISAAGCTSAVSPATAVTVTPLPSAPSISVAGNNTCAVTLSATGGASYIWSLGNTVQSATSANFTPSVSGSYTVRAVSAAGCTSAVSQAAVVTVVSTLPAPTVAVVGATTFCQGGSVTLNATGAPAGAVYTWSNGSTGASITVATSGNYTASYVSAGCNSSASTAIAVTANPLPSAPSISGTASFCAGENTTLSVSNPAPNTTYLWSNGTTANSITVSAAGNFTVRAISNGCTSAVSQATAVTVTPLPSAPAISGTASFCAGGNTTLSVSNPAANTTYLWSNGTTANSITVSAAGSFTVRAISAAGCTSAVSSATAVTINALPTTPSISVAGNNTCAVTLSATGGVSYIWSLGNTVQSATSANFTPSASGSYTVRAINAAGCTSAVSQATTVTVVSTLAAPATAAVGATTFCEGGSVTLNATGAPAGAVYTWSNGSTGASITVSTSGSYTASYTSAGCNSSASTAIVVTANPLPSVPTVSGTASFCAGGNTTLSVSNPAANTTYLWSNGTTANSITVSAAGSFTVRAISAAGCTSAVSPATAVTINALPNVPSISGTASFCAGGNTMLSVSNPAANTTYLWSNGTTANSITVSEAGSFTVRAISAAGCTSAVSPATAVTVNALPMAMISQNGNVVSVMEVPNATYQWLLEGQPIANATGVNYTALTDGNYSVRVTLNGCDAISNVINIQVTSIVNRIDASVKVFPNPSAGAFTLSVENLNNVNIRITDVLGRTIHTETIANELTPLQLPKGVYFLQINSREGATTQRVVVQ